MLQPYRHKPSQKPVIKGQVLPIAAHEGDWGRNACTDTEAGIFALSEQAGRSTPTSPCLPGCSQQDLLVCAPSHVVMLRKSKNPQEEGAAGKSHTTTEGPRRISQSSLRVIEGYKGFTGSRLQGQLEGFLLFFFALHLVWVLAARKHPTLDVGHAHTNSAFQGNEGDKRHHDPSKENQKVTTKRNLRSSPTSSKQDDDFGPAFDQL